MPLHWATPGKNGTPGRNLACNLRVRSAALYTLSYGSIEEWCAGAMKVERTPGLAPGKIGFAIRRLDDFGIARILESGEVDGCCPRSAIFTGSNAGCYITTSIDKWILRH